MAAHTVWQMLDEVKEVTVESSTAPFPEHGTVAFSIAGSWFCLTYKLMQWLKRDVTDCGHPHPTNVHLVEFALGHCMNFIRVGHITYILVEDVE